jgi:NADH-quinone oxidoreductase subunit H
MELIDIIWVIVKAVIVAVSLLSFSNLAVLAERKVSSWIQGRVGPNRTSIPILGAIPILGTGLTRMGLFQPVADGLKLLLKEDPVPAHVNKFYFFLAPVAAMIPAVTTVAVVPFGQMIEDGVAVPIVLADLDIGMLFIFAVSSLGVYGMILAGWASNSKYPFLGGIRSSAQMISYELSMGLSILPVFMWANAPGVESGLSLFSVVQNQQFVWGILFMPISALLFLVSIFAETNRLPFDMPESESELVAGFNTEYGSFKFGLSSWVLVYLRLCFLVGGIRCLSTQWDGNFSRVD